MRSIIKSQNYRRGQLLTHECSFYDIAHVVKLFQQPCLKPTPHLCDLMLCHMPTLHHELPNSPVRKQCRLL